MLEYRQAIADLARQCIQSRHIAGVKTYTGKDPSLAQVDLLPPPRIEMIHLMIYEGHVDDLIMLATSDDFGIENVHVVIMDDQGTIIESGDAEPWPVDPGLWNYMTIAAVPSGTSVIVSAAATDRLGGVGVRSERITVNDHTWDPPVDGKS
jgi:hypothetical protein